MKLTTEQEEKAATALAAWMCDCPSPKHWQAVRALVAFLEPIILAANMIEDVDTNDTDEMIDAAKASLKAKLALPVSDPEKFKRCEWCAEETPIDSHLCDNCIPF